MAARLTTLLSVGFGARLAGGPTLLRELLGHPVTRRWARGGPLARQEEWGAKQP